MEQRKNITPNSVRDIRTGVGAPVLAVVAVVSAVLLYLAVPRTVAAFLALPERHLLADIRGGGDADKEALQALIDSRRRASEWSKPALYSSELALAHLFMAEAAGPTPASRAGHLTLAQMYLEASLRQAPANPHDWTRLAYVQMLTRGPSTQSADALAMSILTARYEPDLMFARLQLSLICWKFFAFPDQDIVRDQVRLAWQEAPDRLLKLVRREEWVDILRSAFAGNPDFLADLERRLAARQ